MEIFFASTDVDALRMVASTPHSYVMGPDVCCVKRIVPEKLSVEISFPLSKYFFHPAIPLLSGAS